MAALRMTAARSERPDLKGRPPLRKRPDDFRAVFIEHGRDGCEPWYRASRKTITRWMLEEGAKELIKARAAYVAKQRANGEWITRSTKLVVHREVPNVVRLPIRDRRKVHPTLARHAAQHLRIVRHSGMIVSQAGNGDWWVGSRRLSAAQMVDFAVSKGFDARSASLQARAAEGVEG